MATKASTDLMHSLDVTIPVHLSYRRHPDLEDSTTAVACPIFCDPCFQLGCCMGWNCGGGGGGRGDGAAIVALLGIALVGVGASCLYTWHQGKTAADFQNTRKELQDARETEHITDDATRAIDTLDGYLSKQVAARFIKSAAGMAATVAIAFLLVAGIAAIISTRRPINFNYTPVAMRGGQILGGAVGLGLITSLVAYYHKPTYARLQALRNRIIDQDGAIRTSVSAA